MQTTPSTETFTTRAAVNHSVEATRAALNRLPPARVEAVRVRIARELEAFVQNEWLGGKPSARTLAQIRFCEIMKEAA